MFQSFIFFISNQTCALPIWRATGLVWFGNESLGARASHTELVFRYAPATPSGRTGEPIRLGLAGLADFEVRADGRVVAAGALRTTAGDDPATAVLNPPSTAVVVPISGDTVDLVVRFTPVEGGIPDAIAVRVGIPPLETDPDVLIAEAVALAGAAEIAVVVVSTSAEVESEGFDRTSLRLPGRQDDLVRAVAAANPRTVVVVNTGAPVLLPWRDDVAAVLATWFPGQEFGAALADVLSGTREPGGRLPVTWPATEDEVPVRTVTPTVGRLDYTEGLHIGHRAYLRAGVSPAYPLGHGLGYTTWQISNVDVPATIARDEEIMVAVTLDNTGDRPGKAVVQVYLERESPSALDRPVRWLGGFAAADVGARTTTVLPVPLSWRRFAHWDGGWCLEPGAYRLRVGFSATDLRIDRPVTIIDNASMPASSGTMAAEPV